MLWGTEEKLYEVNKCELKSHQNVYCLIWTQLCQIPKRMWHICTKYMCDLVHLHVDAKVSQL